MSKITVIDYGSGNLRSVAKALESVGGDVTVSQQPEAILQADRVVLPGVGAFADCYRNLQESGLLTPTLTHINAGKPFLGICVGMQLLFTEGREFGIHKGLDVVKGHVGGFSTDMADPDQPGMNLKVPHMGWNRVVQQQSHPLWAGIPDSSHFYFVHSYYAQPRDGQLIAGSSNYGVEFTAAIAHKNIFATQFHPEKSQKYGLTLLKNFIAWSPEK
ncbi:MAG: imidazole glycerol phosphate synthase subunit HisH [Magnetococcales bacterium]|nr:imidazole glycerol phosphate synthase subunit HisH [Magnetococcales bacterium]